MNKGKIIVAVVFILLFIGFGAQNSLARDNYKTFEVIDIAENSLTLMDSSGNIIDVEKDPTGFKVGYKVRYDTTRNRLKKYRWQDYEIVDISDSTATLKHETGDEITIEGNYFGKYQVGDRVRYDLSGKKINLAKDPVNWLECEVAKSSYDQLTMRCKNGEIIVLRLNDFAGLYQGSHFGRYKVGDKVRYDPEKQRIKRPGRRTYQWKDYEVVRKSTNSITIQDDQGEEQTLQGKYISKYRVGDLVKYDTINDIIKKRRK